MGRYRGRESLPDLWAATGGYREMPRPMWRRNVLPFLGGPMYERPGLLRETSFPDGADALRLAGWSAGRHETACRYLPVYPKATDEGGWRDETKVENIALDIVDDSDGDMKAKIGRGGERKRPETS